MGRITLLDFASGIICVRTCLYDGSGARALNTKELRSNEYEAEKGFI